MATTCMLGAIAVIVVLGVVATCSGKIRNPKSEIRNRPGPDRRICVDLEVVREIESGGNCHKISPCGARGPYQLMRAAWVDAVEAMRRRGRCDDADDMAYDRWVEDETVSRCVAWMYLTDVLPGYLTAARLCERDTTGPMPDSLEARLAAYNAGALRVRHAYAQSKANWQAFLPAETREYLSRYARVAREKRERAAAASDRK